MAEKPAARCHEYAYVWGRKDDGFGGLRPGRERSPFHRAKAHSAYTVHDFWRGLTPGLYFVRLPFQYTFASAVVCELSRDTRHHLGCPA